MHCGCGGVAILIICSLKQIVALAAISLKCMREPDLEQAAVLNVVRQLRQNRYYKNALFVFIIEAAPANSASYIERYLREADKSQIGEYVVMTERNGYRQGVPKGKKETEEYFYQLQAKLTENYLAYSSNIVTFQNEDPTEMRKQLEEMIRNYRLVDRTPDRATGDHIYYLTAKISGASDDLLMALVMILHWRTVFLSKQKYAASREYMRLQRDVDFTL